MMIRCFSVLKNTYHLAIVLLIGLIFSLTAHAYPYADRSCVSQQKVNFWANGQITVPPGFTMKYEFDSYSQYRGLGINKRHVNIVCKVKAAHTAKLLFDAFGYHPYLGPGDRSMLVFKRGVNILRLKGCLSEDYKAGGVLITNASKRPVVLNCQQV